MYASELHARRLNAKEVLTPMKGVKFSFPVADGTVKISGGDQRLRAATLIRGRPERGEEQNILQGESGGLSSPSHIEMTQHRMMRKLKMISGPLYAIYDRHHVEPRVKVYMPKEESFFPLKYIDVTRNTHRSLDVLVEKHVDDYWNVDGDRELSDTWTDFTRFT